MTHVVDVLTSVPTVVAAALLAVLLLLGDVTQRELGISWRRNDAQRAGRRGPGPAWYRWTGMLCTVAFLALTVLRFVNLGA